MIDLNFNVPKCLSFKKVGGETRGMEFYETKLDVLLSDASCLYILQVKDDTKRSVYCALIRLLQEKDLSVRV